MLFAHNPSHLIRDDDEWLFCTNLTVLIERSKKRAHKELRLLLHAEQTEEIRERVKNLMKIIERYQVNTIV